MVHIGDYGKQRSAKEKQMSTDQGWAGRLIFPSQAVRRSSLATHAAGLVRPLGSCGQCFKESEVLPGSFESDTC